MAGRRPMAVNIGAKKVAERLAVASKARSQRRRSSVVAMPAATIAARAAQAGDRSPGDSSRIM
jgi:hypothetical protein